MDAPATPAGSASSSATSASSRAGSSVDGSPSRAPTPSRSGKRRRGGRRQARSAARKAAAQAAASRGSSPPGNGNAPGGAARGKTASDSGGRALSTGKAMSLTVSASTESSGARLDALPVRNGAGKAPAHGSGGAPEGDWDPWQSEGASCSSSLVELPAKETWLVQPEQAPGGKAGPATHASSPAAASAASPEPAAFPRPLPKLEFLTA